MPMTVEDSVARRKWPSTTQRSRFSWLPAVLAALTLSCTASKTPSRVETALANMAKDVLIPIEAESLKNPLPKDGQVIAQGKQLYVQSCALCHSTDGHGRTELGRGMYPPAMDLTSPHVQHWTDAELFWIIQNGVRLTGMPSWQSSISNTDTWKLTRFIHDLPRLDAQAKAQAAAGKRPIETPESREQLIQYGRTLYRQEGCFMCHQLNGEGGKVGPDLTVEGTRGRSDEWLIGHFKDPAAFTQGSLMPPFKNLTDEQLKALTAFLRNQNGQGSREQR
jgi:mono/diheme cytochrome c family protein